METGHIHRGHVLRLSLWILVLTCSLGKINGLRCNNCLWTEDFYMASHWSDDWCQNMTNVTGTTSTINCTDGELCWQLVGSSHRGQSVYRTCAPPATCKQPHLDYEVAGLSLSQNITSLCCHDDYCNDMVKEKLEKTKPIVLPTFDGLQCYNCLWTEDHYMADHWSDPWCKNLINVPTTAAINCSDGEVCWQVVGSSHRGQSVYRTCAPPATCKQPHLDHEVAGLSLTQNITSLCCHDDYCNDMDKEKLEKTTPIVLPTFDGLQCYNCLWTEDYYMADHWSDPWCKNLINVPKTAAMNCSDGEVCWQVVGTSHRGQSVYRTCAPPATCKQPHLDHEVAGLSLTQNITSLCCHDDYCNDMDKLKLEAFQPEHTVQSDARQHISSIVLLTVTYILNIAT